MFDIIRPEYVPGHLLDKLLAQWPNYIAFLASFFYVGIIWLNHRAVFSRVRYCSRSLHLMNLLLLLSSALIPFPTALLSTALQTGNSFDAAVAVEFYAAIGALMCLSWLLVFHVLSVNPHLLEAHVERTFFPQERHRALLGFALYVLARHGGLVFTQARPSDPFGVARLLWDYQRRIDRNARRAITQVGGRSTQATRSAMIAWL